MKNQTFGIEIEMNGILRTKAAQLVAEYFGTHPSLPDHTCYRTQLVKDHTGRTWKLMKDGSIPGPDEEKIELVSPICTWDDIETVQALVRILRAAGAKTDPAKCGIHVHIGAADHTPQTLRNLVNLVTAKDALLRQALAINPDRTGWCQPTEPDFLAHLNTRKPATREDLRALWYSDSDPEYRHWQTDEQRVANHYNRSRYHLLNLHATWSKGTVEFRAFNSTLHAGEIKAYIQLCLAINHRAKTVKTASPIPPTTDNPKYTFRCWLLQLGMIGDEFETARKHLLKHMPGNGAWRSGH